MAEYKLDARVREKYYRITGILMEKNMTVATMESCTAGLIVSLLTDREGASAVVKGGCVTYRTEEKLRQGVDREVIDRFGVYSSQTAEAMAKTCQADLGIGITGTFGNIDPYNAGSDPGKIYFALAFKGRVHSFEKTLTAQPDRYSYKLAAAEAVAEAILELTGGYV